jgi:cyclohexadieny/prephenate dehydrogenase
VAARVDNILVIGLGLIGGSLARSLRQSGFSTRVTACGHREGSLRKGLELGVIDSYSMDLDESLADADIVVIGTPTLTASDMLRDILPRLPARAIITDVASVKGNLVETYRAARAALATTDDGQPVPVAQFVPGHPIAGSERSGVEASSADLFVDHRVILTPLPETGAAANKLVRDMWLSTGAEVVELGVEEHDAILAATSHLPHVLAYCLVDALAQSELSEDIFRFAAGGFRDFTRIASSDPVMWRDISLANRDELLKSIDTFVDHLGALREAVALGDGEALRATFEAAKTARDSFTEKQDTD